jgi:hypothetical protein
MMDRLHRPDDELQVRLRQQAVVAELGQRASRRRS